MYSAGVCWSYSPIPFLVLAMLLCIIAKDEVIDLTRASEGLAEKRELAGIRIRTETVRLHFRRISIRYSLLPASSAPYHSPALLLYHKTEIISSSRDGKTQFPTSLQRLETPCCFYVGKWKIILGRNDPVFGMRYDFRLKAFVLYFLL